MRIRGIELTLDDGHEVLLVGPRIDFNNKGLSNKMNGSDNITKNQPLSYATLRFQTYQTDPSRTTPFHTHSNSP